MKPPRLILALFFALSLSAPLTADVTIEFPVGALTWHYPFDFYRGSAPNFKIALSSDGLLIFNPMVGMCITSETNRWYIALTTFFGDNSIGSPMAGFLGAAGVRPWPWLYCGLVAGMYIQSDAVYRANHLTPWPLVIGDNDVVPLAGVEINVRTDLTDHLFLKSRLIVTPVIANYSFSVGFKL